MAFADLLELTAGGPGLDLARLPEGWGQGRAVFGGLPVALAVHAAERHAPGRAVRGVLTAFHRPCTPGTVHLHLRALRAGRAATHVEVHVEQAGELAVVVQVVLGEDRRTRVRVPAAPFAPDPGPEAGLALPYVPGVVPEFTLHFDYRWSYGAFPFTGGAEPRFGGWARHRAPGPTGAASLCALLDAWPAPVLGVVDVHTPASTVTWMIDLVAPAVGDDHDWRRFEAETVAAGDGYASVTGRLWTADGHLLAASRQLVAEFSPPP